MADREPTGADDRRTTEMTDPRPAQGAAHAGHDLLVLAAAVDRDADAVARSAAHAQTRDCPDCAALFADLQALSTGLAALPRALPVSRDFRLSPERATSLRRRGWRAPFDGLFRSPSLRPLGSALATIGFAGLLLTVGLPGLLGMSGSGSGATAAPAALDQSGGGAPAAAAASPASAPQLSTSGSAPQPSAAPAAPSATGAYAYAAPSRTAGVASGAYDAESGQAFGPASPAPLDPLSFLPWLSLGAFIVGVGLLAVARIGGRGRTGS